MTAWTRGEIAVIGVATGRAPSVHNTQPWELEFRDAGISLFERLDMSLPRHDPTGRDRLMSCGAALANLMLAVRIFGWDADALLFPDRTRPDELARVVVAGRRAPSDEERARYSAIPRRASHRRPFGDRPVPDELRQAVAAAVSASGVRVRPVVGTGEYLAVAELLIHSALALRDDRGYQDELSAWTNTRPVYRPGGVPGRTEKYDTLPWVGLVRETTQVPEPNVLAARLAGEYLLLLETPDDGPVDQLLAGRAMQEVWLAATHAGLAGSVLTQPLQVAATRAGLVERLGLRGFPQALLRFGDPVGVTPPSPRVPLADLVRPARSDAEERIR
jgi:nitroreductase